MLRIILYIAISTDGFIADKNGGVGWLDQYNAQEIAQEMDTVGYGFNNFYKSIDTLIIGSTTYEQMLTFGDWAFSDKKSYIFVTPGTPGHDSKEIEYIGTDIPTFMNKIASYDYKRVWLVGGAKLAESFYKLGLIDECIITIVPTTLGDGIPLLPAIVQGQGFALTDTKTLNSGIVQKHYVR